MFNFKKIALVVVSSLVAAFYVSAAEVNEIDLTQLLNKFDNDKNGLLSKAEVITSKNKILLARFDEIDVNNDGGLSQKELESFNTGI